MYNQHIDMESVIGPYTTSLISIRQRIKKVAEDMDRRKYMIKERE